MKPEGIRALLGALAEQQYLFHLLVRTFVERGILQPGEPASRWNDQEFAAFHADFLNHLMAIGLGIDEQRPPDS